MRGSRSAVFAFVFAILGVSFVSAALSILRRGSFQWKSQQGAVEVFSSSHGPDTYYRMIAGSVGLGVLLLAASAFLTVRSIQAARAAKTSFFPPMTPFRVVLLIGALILIFLAIVFRNGVRI
jgi:drug/metabolite transporter (DMT)-like permease